MLYFFLFTNIHRSKLLILHCNFNFIIIYFLLIFKISKHFFKNILNHYEKYLFKSLYYLYALFYYHKKFHYKFFNQILH